MKVSLGEHYQLLVGAVAFCLIVLAVINTALGGALEDLKLPVLGGAPTATVVGGSRETTSLPGQ